MNSVVDLIEEVQLKQLATPSNYRLGQEIAESGGVTFTEFTPVKIAAQVVGEQTRNSILELSPEGLSWKCTCSGNTTLFCKHLVATAIEAGHTSPSRHD